MITGGDLRCRAINQRKSLCSNRENSTYVDIFTLFIVDKQLELQFLKTRWNGLLRDLDDEIRDLLAHS